MSEINRKPVIGLVPLWDSTKNSFWMLPGYLEGITQGGGLPLILPLTEDPAELAQLVTLCDGFLFTGGHDVSPWVYGAERAGDCAECCEGRDRMERQLLPLVLAADKPALGICRGIQLMNAVLGGSLYQHLPRELPSPVNHRMQPPYDGVAHPVALLPGTPLQLLLGQRELGVNSCHHQGLRDLSPELAVMATAPDGLVEAVYRPASRFVWAVQWHPEFSYRKDAASRRIFAALVEAAESIRKKS